MNPLLNICLSFYRYLAKAYPPEFRIVYGEDLDRLGEVAVPEAWRRYGVWGLVRLLADIAVRLPAEYLGEVRQDVVYSVRVLARAPGFAAVAPPSALVTPRRPVSYPYFEHYRDQPQVAGAATAFLGSVPFAVAPGGERNAK